MKKEKNSSVSSGGPQKTGLSISVVNVKNNSDVGGGDTPATPKAGDAEAGGQHCRPAEQQHSGQRDLEKRVDDRDRCCHAGG